MPDCFGYANAVLLNDAAMRELRAVWVVAAAILFGLSGCGPTLGGVRPDAGRWAVDGWVGGPVVSVAGAPMPLPLLAAGARYGLSTSTDVGAHLHLTSLAAGVGAVDTDIRHVIERHPKLGRTSVELRGRLAGGWGNGAGFGVFEGTVGARHPLGSGPLWAGGALNLLEDLRGFGAPHPSLIVALGGTRWSLELRGLFLDEVHDRNPIGYALPLPGGVIGLLFTYGVPL